MREGGATGPLLKALISDAERHVLRAASEGFPDAVHRMRFPTGVPWWRYREHASDLFARSVIGGVLCDIAGAVPPDQGQRWFNLAWAEAHHVAAGREPVLAGGWRYFPTLASLPPDLDSLAAAIRLFASVAPEHLSLCETPLAVALDGIGADGGRETWLLSDQDPWWQRRRMERAAQRHWGVGADVEVLARFYASLADMAPASYRDAIALGSRHVIGRLGPDGLWRGTWYAGTMHATDLCLSLVRSAGGVADIEARVLSAVRGAQNDDGGWGDGWSSPLEAASALWMLATGPAPDAAVLAKGIDSLADLQTRDGTWNVPPWIRMEVGRTRPGPSHVLTHGSGDVTNAFILRALVAVDAALD